MEKGSYRYKMEVTDGNCSALFKLHFMDSNREAVVAARGERKHEKGHWKYQSEAAFVHAQDEPWHGMPLKEFQNAKARAGSGPTLAVSSIHNNPDIENSDAEYGYPAGVLEWLTWIIQHTAASGEAEEPEASHGDSGNTLPDRNEE